MVFIDYYALLRLPRDATPKDIRRAFVVRLKEAASPEEYNLVTEAYKTLNNRYRRMRYDRTFGYLLAIQPQVESYPNAVHYQLHSVKPYLTLQYIIQSFKTWIRQKYDFDWQEAQQAHFSYDFREHEQNPRLVLRFPQAVDRQGFAERLLAERVVREV